MDPLNEEVDGILTILPHGSSVTSDLIRKVHGTRNMIKQCNNKPITVIHNHTYNTLSTYLRGDHTVKRNGAQRGNKGGREERKGHLSTSNMTQKVGENRLHEVIQKINLPGAPELRAAQTVIHPGSTGWGMGREEKEKEKDKKEMSEP